MTRLDGRSTLTSVERIMQRYDLQALLFTPRVSRLALCELHLSADAGDRRVRVNVWRNHAVEPLLPLIEPYCHHRAWYPDFRLSGYDDTLLFTDWREADAELLWLDSDRMLSHSSFADWANWLESRLRTLRAWTVAPVILATWSEDEAQSNALRGLAESIPSVYFADLGEATTQAGVPLLDGRSAVLAGTPIGKAAQLVLARNIACHWLPAALFPPVKAVVLDLDQTLHHGVLGEQGIAGVKLTPGHAEFQRQLKGLQQRGVFLALVSRNERPDVEALFNERTDYPLRWDDFSAVEVSWGDKGEALERIANTLRIAPDAMLFVDDNPGELGSVTARLPQLHTVLAHPDATLTWQVVQFYPGLWRWRVNNDDAKRIQDLKANSERESLAGSLSEEEYFRSLNVTLSYRHDAQDQLYRLTDLCQKTNQFNLALRRLNQVELAERMSRADACVTSVQLKDRFSDSGVIGVIVAERQGQKLVVEEVCISCRALGRRLEDTIIALALRTMPIFAGCEEVAFTVEHGPRNGPALDWLVKFIGPDDAPPTGHHVANAKRLSAFIAPAGISVIGDNR